MGNPARGVGEVNNAPNPFALSLSKGFPSLKSEGRGFDKLSPNGFSVECYA
jgi:hypothetical protein